MKSRQVIQLLIVTFLEGIVAGIIYFSSPSMEKNSILWGLSASRLAIGFLFLCLLLSLGILFLISCIHSDQLNRFLQKIDQWLLEKYMLFPISLVLFTMLILCIFYSFILYIPVPPQFTILYLIYPRVMPIVAWIGLFCLQIILLMVFVYKGYCTNSEFLNQSRQHARLWVKNQKIIQPFLVIISSVLSLIPNLPKYNPVPSLDSGVFLYFGDQILKGKLPYRDMWDHKPPAIFYTDALGLWIGNGSRIGVWFLEGIAITATGLFSYYFLQKYFGKWTAMFASIIAVTNLIFIMDYGNNTEEFALPFQYLALLLFTYSLQRKSSNWLFFLIGVSGGYAFMYKQTMIGIWIVITIMLVVKSIRYKDFRTLVHQLALISTGTGLICLLVAIYFALQGQLQVFWDAAFRFNFIYVKVSFSERMYEFHRIWRRLSSLSPYYVIGLFTWLFTCGFLLINRLFSRNVKILMRYHQSILITSICIACASFIGSFFYKDQLIQFIWAGFFIGLGNSFFITVFQKKPWIFPDGNDNQNHNCFLPLQIAVLSFFVEFLLISVSARYYLHYFMGLILPFSIFIAFLLWSATKLKNKVTSRFCYVILLVTTVAYTGYKIERMSVVKQNEQVTNTAGYIVDHTNDDDSVLVWGAQTLLNYITQREEPTRFVYTTPLYTNGYVSDRLVNELYSDLINKQPKLIVDTKSPLTPFISFSESGECILPDSDFHESMREVFKYICQNYHQRKVIGKDEWVVFEQNQ